MIMQISKIVSNNVSNNVIQFLSTPMNNIKKVIEQTIKDNKTNSEDLNKKVDQLLQGQEETKQAIDSQGEQSNHMFETIENKVDQKERAGKTKSLFLTTCLAAIIEVYDDPEYNYHQQFKLHQFAIKNQLSSWNQYLNTDGKKGKPPLPDFDLYRHTDKETFKKWVIYVFFPDYKNRAHKDALDNASHPDMNNMSGSGEEEIIDAVEESLANDSNNNTKNEQSESPSNGHE